MAFKISKVTFKQEV